jgi:uncharacterized Fe-S cluster protein YjdI
VYDVDQLAGLTVYESRPGLIAFVHTEIGERYEGHGLGSTLVRAALDDVRGLPAVFDTARWPWIMPDTASADDVIEVVGRRPSGALELVAKRTS